MKAIVYTQYGPPDVLHLKDIQKPTPKDNEVLIKVHASSVNAAEPHVVRGEPFLVRLMIGGIFKPSKTIPGADVAGVIEAVGNDVKQFKVGDAVFGDLSSAGWGAYAEYVCAPENILVMKPTNITFEQAASVPLAGISALQGLRDAGKIQAGQKVLVNGASGGVGMFAVQIAKALGAEVTAVCSTRKMDMVRSIGADHVIDYTQGDFLNHGRQYDLILDAAAFRPFTDYARALTRQGIYVLVGGSTSLLFRTMLMAPIVSMRSTQKFKMLMANPSQKDLVFMKELLEAGKVIPVIDRCYGLAETPDAMRYLEDRKVQGKVVITMAHSPA